MWKIQSGQSKWRKKLIEFESRDKAYIHCCPCSYSTAPMEAAKARPSPQWAPGHALSSLLSLAKASLLSGSWD